MIEEHIDVLHKCSDLLIQKEKIGQEEFEQLFEQMYKLHKNSRGVIL